MITSHDLLPEVAFFKFVFLCFNMNGYPYFSRTIDPIKKASAALENKDLTIVTDQVTINSMIKSFAHKGLKALFDDGIKKGIQTKHTDKLLDILDHLDAANEIRDMGYPGSGIHRLLPKSEARWAVSVSGNWRITFIFKNGDAYDVNYEDYH
jgi:toxin HigB-1